MELRALQDQLPLPPGWGAPEVVRHQTKVSSVEIDLAGLSVTSSAGVVVTAGAGCVGNDPLPRAYYELLERTGIVEALGALHQERIVRDLSGVELRRGLASAWLDTPEASASFRPSRSNGVALGPSWEFACERAAWELAERDQILRSWYGATRPELVVSPNLMPAGLRDAYDITTHRLGPAHGVVVVVAIVCWPREAARPLVLGYGARPELEAALHAARDECLQRLGFLWDEALPAEEPRFSPTPDYHQEYYLWPGSRSALRRWLDEGHVGAGQGVEESAPRGASEVEFLDLTPPSLTGRAAIAKAIPQREFTLGFGKAHPSLPLVPAELEVHPVA